MWCEDHHTNIHSQNSESDGETNKKKPWQKIFIFANDGDGQKYELSEFLLKANPQRRGVQLVIHMHHTASTCIHIVASQFVIGSECLVSCTRITYGWTNIIFSQQNIWNFSHVWNNTPVRSVESSLIIIITYIYNTLNDALSTSRIHNKLKTILSKYIHIQNRQS